MLEKLEYIKLKKVDSANNFLFFLAILTNFKTNPELYPKGFKTASNNVITSVQLMKYTKDNFSNIYDEISEFVLIS